jgi:hypothetical protein
MKIRAVVIFDLQSTEEMGIDINSDDLIGEVVKVKSGTYENLLMGSIVEAEDLMGSIAEVEEEE